LARCKKENNMSKAVSYSIAKRSSQYILQFVDVLCDTLERTQKLKKLTISNIRLAYSHISKIANSISQNHSLTSLCLRGIFLGDEGLLLLLPAIRAQPLKELSLESCGISVETAEPIISRVNQITLNGVNEGEDDIMQRPCFTEVLTMTDNPTEISIISEEEDNQEQRPSTISVNGLVDELIERIEQLKRG